MTPYSTEELKQFKTIIECKLKKAIQENEAFMKIISKDNNGTDDTSWSFNMLEDGQATLSKEENNILAHKQQKFIEALQAALVRVGNGTYGICVVTGEKIPFGRLSANPCASTTITNKK